jgi:hypothetical protein
MSVPIHHTIPQFLCPVMWSKFGLQQAFLTGGDLALRGQGWAPDP